MGVRNGIRVTNLGGFGHTLGYTLRQKGVTSNFVASKNADWEDGEHVEELVKLRKKHKKVPKNVNQGHF